ncbi:MAG TPA: aldo/keto reductase, partial [Euzebya sp.]|nr:aldo/keto reductase [Euzebya sp.]
AVQSEYSLWTRDIEAEILPAMRDLGIGLVAYSPLGRGFLTGTITSSADLEEDDWRRGNPRFQGDAFQANLDLVAKVGAMAAERGVTAAQLALAWVMAQGTDIIPIPGTTRPERLSENVAALEVQLTASDLEALEAIAPVGVAVGDRYPTAMMGNLNR